MGFARVGLMVAMPVRCLAVEAGPGPSDSASHRLRGRTILQTIVTDGTAIRDIIGRLTGLKNRKIMRHQKFTPRADYRIAESLRAKASGSLSEQFPELKALTVEFAYFSPEGVTRNSKIKYTVNPAFAKSVFRLDCMNPECVAGDFDLSAVIAQAVAARQATATGEMCCQGWLSKTTIDRVHCHNLLRYELSLTYEKSAPAGIPELQAV